MPDFLQTAFAVSLGATYKSFELMKTPIATTNKMLAEMKSCVTVPPDAGETLKSKAQALAAVWMEKGATYMEECKQAGLKFTEGK